MKKAKKLLLFLCTLILTLCFALAFAACGDSNPDSGAGGSGGGSDDGGGSSDGSSDSGAGGSGGGFDDDDDDDNNNSDNGGSLDTRQLGYELNSDQSSYRVFGYSNAKGTVIIPDTYEGLPVTSIGEWAFNCDDITSITIPASVTSISENAFGRCNSLTIYCEAASKPSGWDSKWNYDYDEFNCPVVWDCKYNDIATDGYIYIVAHDVRYALKDGYATVARQARLSGDIIIPKSIDYNDDTYSVTSIVNSAFSDCTHLISVTLPDSVASMGDYVFAHCNKLVLYCEAKEKPNGWCNEWNYLDWDTFCPVVWNCKNNEVTDNGYTYAIIGGTRYALKDGNAKIAGQSENLRGNVSIPKTVAYDGKTYKVTSIGAYAFNYCNQQSVTIPSGITSIENNAFNGCWNMTSMTIPSGVTSIGYEAFSGCYNMKSIVIPDSVTSIGSRAFGYCDDLIETENGVQYVGKWVVGCDTSATQVTFKKNTKYFADGAFADCSGLTSITIPSGVVSIGSEAFYSCDRLTNVTIPSSVVSIGEYAFLLCGQLTDITFKGTKDQWGAIDKVNFLANFEWLDSIVIHCTNGDIFFTDADLVD